MNKEVTIKGARIVQKHFAGHPRYKNSTRFFTIFVDDEDQIKMLNECGLDNSVKVIITYNDKFHPNVTLYSDNHETVLDSIGINLLDWMVIKEPIDLTVLICPYKDYNGKTRIYTYLKSMNVTKK